jgi:hypothetical protein
MPKKHPALKYEFFVEDLDNIPKELDDLMDAIDLALAGNGSQLADLILNGDIVDLVPKELLAELIRNTKKSKRPTITKIIELDLKHPGNTENEICLTGKSQSILSKGAITTTQGRPKNEDNSKRNEQIYYEYKELIKTNPKWQSLKQLSSTYNLSESTIEDILKLESSLNAHGFVNLGNGKFIAKKWWIYGKQKP